MEDAKLESYYDDMKSRAPKGKRGGLGSSKGPGKRKNDDSGAADGSNVYSMFVKAGDSGYKNFDEGDGSEDGEDDDAAASSGSSSSGSSSSSKGKKVKKGKKEKKGKKGKKEKKSKKSKKDKKEKKDKKRKRSPSPSSSSDDDNASSSSSSSSSSSGKPSSSKKAKKGSSNGAAGAHEHPLSTSAAVATRAIPLRLRPGQDLVKTLTKFCDEKGVAAGFVGCGAGSLSKVTLRLAEEDVRSHEASFEVVSIGGTVHTGGHHLHISVSDRNGKTFGGHAFPGCIVRTTMEVLVFVLDGCTFAREMDDETGYDELVIRE